MHRNHTIKLTDSILLADELSNKNVTGFNTRIIITARNCHYDGSQDIEIKRNQTALPGRTKLLEDNFMIKPNMEQHIFINDNVLGDFDPITGEPSSNATTAYFGTDKAIMPRNKLNLFRKRRVEFWCAGDGAVNKTLISQSWPPHKTNTRLYHMIPFMVIDKGASLNDDQKKLYKLGVLIEDPAHPLYNHICYYFKKITYEKVDGIDMKVNNSPYKPKTSDTTQDLNANTSGGYQNSFSADKTQLNYVDMQLKVDKWDFKNYFRDRDGNLRNANISEVGLITGLNCVKIGNSLVPIEDIDSTILQTEMENHLRSSEVYDAELFAHLTFDPYPVSRENNEITFDYRIFS